MTVCHEVEGFLQERGHLHVVESKIQDGERGIHFLIVIFADAIFLRTHADVLTLAVADPIRQAIGGHQPADPEKGKRATTAPSVPARPGDAQPG